MPLPTASLGPHEVLVQVRAVGLNFRDVLNVLGEYPGDPGDPGSDVAGVVVRVGAEVTGFKAGDNVFGLGAGCLKTYVVLSKFLLAPLPGSYSFADASVLPTVYATVELGLASVAGLRVGERLLVHAAAGGVGIAAIQYAKRVGAVVYATAGSKAKHDFLRSLGVEHITSSRDAATFLEDMQEWVGGGKGGVHVVLNSLSGDFITHSVALLAKGGKFLEIGKRGIWSHERMSAARPDVSYSKIEWDTVCLHRPEEAHEVLLQVSGAIASGHITPMPTHLFDLRTQGVEAFRFLRKGANIGKVVLTIEAPTTSTQPHNANAHVSPGVHSMRSQQTATKPEMTSVVRRVATPSGPSLDEVQQAVVETVQSIAGVGVGLDDPLMEAGVDSLGSVELRNELTSRFGVELPATLVLDHPSVADVSRHISEAVRRAAPSHAESVVVQDDQQSHAIASGAGMFQSAGGTSLEDVRRQITEVVQSIIGTSDIDVDSPLMEAGMDSLGSVEVRNELSNRFAIDMPSTVVLDHPTIGALTHVVLQASPQLATAADDNEAPTGIGRGAQPVMVAGPSLHDVEQEVREAVESITGSRLLNVEQPLMEHGVDSLASVEVRNELSGRFGIDLPSTVVMDHPTVSALSSMIWRSTHHDMPMMAISSPSAAQFYFSEFELYCPCDLKHA
eukprot:jgi/Tetstr1/432836/TSEL_022185.t1